jgi:hypothetical protein
MKIFVKTFTKMKNFANNFAKTQIFAKTFVKKKCYTKLLYQIWPKTIIFNSYCKTA